MAYTPTTWTDRQVTNPLRFTLNNISTNVYDLVPTEGTVVQAGTPLNASNLNNIENGLVGHETRLTTAEGNITSLSANKADLTGATFTGTVTAPTINATSNLQENGTNLSAKYLALAGGALSGALTIQLTTASVTNLAIKNSGNDNYTRFVADASYGYIQSGNFAFSASKGLALTGFNGASMTDFKVLANTLTLNGNTTITGTLVVSSTISGTVINGTTNLQEAGTNLSAKYMQLNANNAMTGQLTVTRNNNNIIVKGTALTSSNLATVDFQDSAGTVQGQVGAVSTGNTNIALKATTGNIDIISTGGIITLTGSVTTPNSMNLTGANTGIEIGARGATNTPFLDFHTSSTDVDYDVRLLASGGNGSVGGGTLTVSATSTAFSGGVTASGQLTANDIVANGQIIANRSTFNILAKGTASGNSNTATFNIVDSASTTQASFGKLSSANGDITIKAFSGDLELTTNTGIVKVTDDLTITGTVNMDRSATGINLAVKNSVDDGFTRFITTGAGNYIQSGNYAFSASKDMQITGINATNMNTLSLKANNVVVNGTLSSNVTYTALAMQNGWTANGTGTGLAYAILPGNVCHITGIITGGTRTPGTLLATLPAGVVPLRTYWEMCMLRMTGDVKMSSIDVNVDRTIAVGGIGWTQTGQTWVSINIMIPLA